MTEEENTYKISVPLISDDEIKQIDSYLDDIVHQFTRQLVHDKDLAIAQHIIQKQQEEINEMAMFIANLDIDENICKHQISQFCKEESREVSLDICINCIKQYFESKV